MSSRTIRTKRQATGKPSLLRVGDEGNRKKSSTAPTRAIVGTGPRPALIDDVGAILRQARRQAYAASNFIMVEAYWRIGQRIVQEEQGGKDRAKYGSHLIRNLARQLGEEFGGGVAVASLKNFRQFYLTIPGFEKSSAPRSQLTWTHWRLVMRVDDPAARDYYIRETAEQGWNTRQLERNIATHSYRRLLSAPRENRPPLAWQARPSSSSRIRTCSNSSACRNPHAKHRHILQLPKKDGRDE